MSTERGGFAGIVKRQFPKPLIAAVNGTALGGGFEIALSCDLIVAAEGAVFGLPEVKRGLIAGAGGLIRVGRMLPRQLALEIAMTGEPISAKRAQEVGLVSRVMPAGALLDTALALAEQVAANGPLAVRLSKELVDVAPDLTMDEAWARNDAYGQQIMGSEDMREGLRAFAEKRRPNWKGR
jgi:enoyl-CoA hydratase/carnithine racemase